MGTIEIAAEWKLVVWALRVWWRWKQIENLCETERQDIMYSFNSANTRVGGADAYLRQNSEFSKGRARPRMERLHSKLIFCLVIGIAMVHHDPPGKFKGFAAQ